MEIKGVAELVFVGIADNWSYNVPFEKSLELLYDVQRLLLLPC